MNILIANLLILWVTGSLIGLTMFGLMFLAERDEFEDPGIWMISILFWPLTCLKYLFRGIHRVLAGGNLLRRTGILIQRWWRY